MPEIAEREPKVISAGHVHASSVLFIKEHFFVHMRLLIVVIVRRKVYALNDARDEKMMLFTPS